MQVYTFQEKLRAQGAVANAKRKGVLKPEPCEVCGKQKVHAHHYLGYERANWLKVKWLCQSHHYWAHYEQDNLALKHTLSAYILSERITLNQLLAIQKIIKQQTNE
jgi:hypothetical protein